MPCLREAPLRKQSARCTNESAPLRKRICPLRKRNRPAGQGRARGGEVGMGMRLAHRPGLADEYLLALAGDVDAVRGLQHAAAVEVVEARGVAIGHDAADADGHTLL